MGFWDSLFKDNHVILTGNNTDLPGVLSSRQTKKESDSLEEYASELYGNNSTLTDNSYSGNGVYLKESSNGLRLTYDGILAKDGAQDVYAVIGLEDSGALRDEKYYQMQKSDGEAYEVLFPDKSEGKISVAFKDGANHWDNNSGKYYAFVK